MSGFTQLLVLVMAALAVVGILVARRKTIAKMAARNIVRKKTYSAIVIAGLLIATAMISGSLVVGDTLDYIIREDVFVSTGAVDEVVSVRDEAGDDVYFDQSIGYDLAHSVSAGQLQFVDRAAPAIREEVVAIEPSSKESSPTTIWFGVDAEHMIDDLTRPDGTPVSTEDISGGKVVVNQKLADRLDVSAGDTFVVISGSGTPILLEVSFVAKNEGLARWQYGAVVFADLTFTQTALTGTPGEINRVDVSNRGGVQDGYRLTAQAVAELEEVLPTGHIYSIEEVKQDGVETAEKTADSVAQIFIVMSSFAIIAGIALIINIFVMLAEERKPEMGISRAIGMQRGDLTQSFLFEGVVYALIASAVGAFVGLVVAAVMISLFGAVVGGGGLEFNLSFEWESLGIAACAGFLITLATVAAASWRVSRLNIVRAIRDIPEPVMARSDRRYVTGGILAMALGVLLLYAGVASKQQTGVTGGPALLAVGAAMVAVRFVGPRIPFTAVGVFLIYWEIDPTNIRDTLFGQISAGIEMFIVSGMVLVTGGVLLVMFNSDLVLNAITRIAGNRRSILPVFRAATSYPMNKRFRTGLSLFIFALIMFTVVVVAMMASFQRESVETMAEKFAGGYDILAMSVRDISRENLSNGFDRVNQTLGEPVISHSASGVTAPVGLMLNATSEPHASAMIGFDEHVLTGGGFSLSQRLDGYASDADAWAAVASDPGLVIMDGSVVPTFYGMSFGTFFVDLGDTITVAFQDGTRTNVTVIGIMDQLFVQGVFTNSAFVEDRAPSYDTNLFYVAVRDGVSASHEEVAQELERAFVEYGLVTVVMRDTVREFMSMVSSVMQLMEVFLGIGLVVGITGLGIITIRNVAERRQEIGVMRAIGYQRTMVLNVFLIETSFVSLLGIAVGVLLGLVLSWRMFDWGGFSENARFVIPWGEIALLVSVAFVITLASTLPPSRKASTLAPAEALRRID